MVEVKRPIGKGEKCEAIAKILGDRVAFPGHHGPGLSVRVWLMGQALAGLATMEGVQGMKAVDNAYEIAEAVLGLLASHQLEKIDASVEPTKN